VPVAGCLDVPFDRDQIGMDLSQRDFVFRHGGADVAGDVQVVAFLGDTRHRDALGVARLFPAELVGLDDLGDMRRGQAVLALAFLEMLGGINEEHVVRLFALLEHEHADRDAGGVEGTDTGFKSDTSLETLLRF